MLIVMAVWDTVENTRSWMTALTLASLRASVNWRAHRLVIVDNASCGATQELYTWYGKDDRLPFSLIRLSENVGTAAAINQAWALRRPGEHCVKMDNDVMIHQAGWADWMEDVFERCPDIGICGLKRKDLAESPFAEGDMHSEVYMLPHELGQRWLVVEEVKGVMGTCQAYSSALLDKIGGLYQMQDEGNLYGFDDSLASHRARLAGFKSVFLHGFEIEHVDPGGTQDTQRKRDNAGKWFDRYNQVVLEYEIGVRSIYYEPV